MSGTSNFLQHNPTAANQEIDSVYVTDSTRQGGISVDQIMSSEWMNKVWYQSSTFIAAFAGALANKGYTLSDANLSTLEAVLANVLTNADTKPIQITVPFSPTPTFDCSQAQGFYFNLTANVTSSTLINVPPSGSIVTFFIVSTNPGNLTFAWPVNIVYPGNVQTESNQNLYTQAFISNGVELYPLEGVLGVLQQYINSLNSDVSSINSEISTIDSQISTINGEISAIEGAFGNSFAESGYQKLYNGLIIQWGLSTPAPTGQMSGAVSVTFPIPFPNACFNVQTTSNGPASGVYTTGRFAGANPSSISTTGFVANIWQTDAGSSLQNFVAAYWVAIGY